VLLSRFLGVFRHARDAHGQPVDAVAVARNELFGGRGVVLAERLDQAGVDVHQRGAARQAPTGSRRRRGRCGPTGRHDSFRQHLHDSSPLVGTQRLDHSGRLYQEGRERSV